MYQVVEELREREKELNCLYKVTELLNNESLSQEDLFRQLVNIIPEGWQYPGVLNCRITLEERSYTTPDFFETQWHQCSEIVVDGNSIGKVEIYYSRVMEEGNPFLQEEQKLLNAISEQIAQYLFRQRLRYTIHNMREGNNEEEKLLKSSEDNHWRWRYSMAKEIAANADLSKYGLEAIYLIGSAKAATAGPGSDLDLLVHFNGTPEQKNRFEEWIDGWSKSLAVINYHKTGYKVEGGLIDLHLVTDEDLRKKTSYAVMIESHHNSARLLIKAKQNE